ncbi:Cleavage and polyadenylation specificity factor subunit 3 [Phytophthora pseudosyringae]|uniref:Cleavage and polyadenylation specificity factor subunit 3 n=1 Tax=Phytophthora pseudosyringae TaxID=221518 RepID=A0A8T1VCA0_9STRA|nr:Cleavage and polyadenylation specificity factor subunit 3 [Phytophthora pseudosyringae]
MSKRRLAEEAADERHIMRIMPLGAGNEVGRSCIVLKFKGKTIMLDCGVHPGYSGHGSLPFFDGVEAEEIDLLLITHFHIDHVAALPHFTEKTNFKGRVFMTHPTKAVMQMMLRDFLRVSNISVDDQIYDDKDLNNCVAKVEIIDFHQEMMHNGIKFTPYNAGHVLGACMYLIEIGGVKVLYTGDYSLENDRHLMAAELPACSPDVLIVESTYGVQVHQSVVEREGRFTGQVEAVVRRGGRCLIPVFALGRTQELLLILDEHWRSHPDLQDIPIYFASKLAAKALRVYQTYINMMNDRIRKQIAISNPFQFEHISNLKSMDDFDDSGPSVVMASPGMLQSGVSRQLFERWCSDKRNACLIPGYVVEGTLAKKILSEPTEIAALDGRIIPMNCTVEYISFSAHADFVGTSGFVEKLTPPNIVLVHGEKNEMMRLKSALNKKFNDPKVYHPSITTPANMQEIVLEFKGEKIAKAIGGLASDQPKNGKVISGLLVEVDSQTHLMDKEDLSTYTKLISGSIAQKQHVPFEYNSFDVLITFIRQMYEDVVQLEKENRVVVCKQVVVTRSAVSKGATEKLVVEWTSAPTADMIADSVIALAMHAQASPASFKLSGQPTAACPHDHSKKTDACDEAANGKDATGSMKSEEEETEEETPVVEKMEDTDHPASEQPADEKQAETDLEKAARQLGENDQDALNLLIVFRLLKDQYGDVDLDFETNKIHVRTPSGIDAVVNHASQEIECKDAAFKLKLQTTIRRIESALKPITTA